MVLPASCGIQPGIYGCFVWIFCCLNLGVLLSVPLVMSYIRHPRREDPFQRISPGLFIAVPGARRARVGEGEEKNVSGRRLAWASSLSEAYLKSTLVPHGPLALTGSAPARGRRTRSEPCPSLREFLDQHNFSAFRLPILLSTWWQRCEGEGCPGRVAPAETRRDGRLDWRAIPPLQLQIQA